MSTERLKILDSVSNADVIDGSLKVRIDPNSTIADEIIAINSLTGATYTNLQELNDNLNSAGVFTGFAVTDGGSGTVDIAAGTGLLKTTDSDTGVNVSFDYAGATGVSLTDNSTNWIYIDYNSGTPTHGAVVDWSTLDLHTQIIIAKAWRSGTDLHIIETSQLITDFQRRLMQMNYEKDGFIRTSGMVISTTGLYVEATAGVAYEALTRHTTSAIDTDPGGGADTFSYWYQTTGTWTEVTGETEIDNLQYNNVSSGLATLTAQRYGVHWVFMDHDSHINIVYGIGDYTLAEAQVAVVPTVPSFLSEFAILIGKIVIQKSSASTYSTESAFTNDFSGTNPSDHSTLSKLAWTLSGHTGTATKVPAFDGSGAATEIQDLSTTASPTFAGLTVSANTPTLLIKREDNSYVRQILFQNSGNNYEWNFETTTGTGSDLTIFGGNDSDLGNLQEHISLINKSTVIINEGKNKIALKVSGDTTEYLFYTDADNNRVGVSTSAPQTEFSVNGGTILNQNYGSTLDTDIRSDNLHAVFVDASADRVGIGTDTPLSLFHVSDSTIATIRISGADDFLLTTVDSECDFQFFKDSGNGVMDFQIFPQDGSSTSLYRMGLSNGSTGTSAWVFFDRNSTNYQHYMASSNVDSYICRQGGQFGIGTTSASYKLHVVGNAGKTNGGTAWVAISDERLKTTQTIDTPLAKLLQLNGVKFTWNQLYQDTFAQRDEADKPIVNTEVLYGFTAQNVETVFPEMVEENDGWKWTKINLEGIIVEALREIDTRLKALEA